MASRPLGGRTRSGYHKNRTDFTPQPSARIARRDQRCILLFNLPSRGRRRIVILLFNLPSRGRQWLRTCASTKLKPACGRALGGSMTSLTGSLRPPSQRALCLSFGSSLARSVSLCPPLSHALFSLSLSLLRARARSLSLSLSVACTHSRARSLSSPPAYTLALSISFSFWNRVREGGQARAFPR